mgnify:CR=1 FL=1
MKKNAMPSLSAGLEENLALFHELLPIRESFDLIERRITIGGKALGKTVAINQCTSVVYRVARIMHALHLSR